MFSKNLPEADYVCGCALYSIQPHLNRGSISHGMSKSAGIRAPGGQRRRARVPSVRCRSAGLDFKLNGPPREIAGGGSSAARNRPPRPLLDGALLRGVDYERRPEPLVRTLPM